MVGRLLGNVRAGQKLQLDRRYDWVVIGALAWLVLGAFVDGWAHYHGLVDVTYFAPWHALLYTGFLAVAAVHGAPVLVNRLRGFSVADSIPKQYGLSLAGICIFAVGLVADLVWHLLFGVEASLQALLSPTHFLLVTGLVLMFSGPFRVLWQQNERDLRWSGALPGMLSLGATLAIACAFFMYLSPYDPSWVSRQYGTMFDTSLMVQLPNRWTLGELANALGVASLLFESMLLPTLFYFIGRRLRLPVGAWSLVFVLSGSLIATFYDNYPQIAVALVTGIVADLLSARYDLKTCPVAIYRSIGPVLSLVFAISYFVVVAATGGTWWAIHVWAGAIVLCGLTGLVVGFVVERDPALNNV